MRLAVLYILVLAVIASVRAEKPVFTGPGRGVPMKEMTDAVRALKDAAISVPDSVPLFSFKIGGACFPAIAKEWKKEKGARKLDEVRTEHSTVWHDPATSLSVKMVAVEYLDYPAVEWTVYVRNEGATTSPMIESLCGLDAAVQRGADGEFVLHHQLGSVVSREDYRPFDTRLEPGSEKRITASGGRSTDSNWPYFNIEWGGEGLLLAVGWPGQWAATFVRDKSTGLTLRAGQEHTRFRLMPGEEVRTPLIVCMSWKGERFDAQNMWRQWMLKHSMPRPHGKQIEPEISGCSSHQTVEMQNANTENQMMFIDRYLEEKLKLDYWWMDAGWYPNNGGWGNTGTWEVDEKRFPGGLRAITDHGRERAVKSIVWFEPERVTPKTWLYENHPEWLLGSSGDNRLLNLGHPEALKWVIERTSSLIDSEGIDLYRQDYNIDPLGYWRESDGPEREGIT